jgi:glycosyltransferase involved in cell wall biosynthesis
MLERSEAENVADRDAGASGVGRRGAVLVAAYHGQPSSLRLAALAAEGKRPRKDYVELARALEADVIDFDYLTHCASPLGRAVTRRGGLLAGQLYEALANRKDYTHVWAWTEKIGLPLALLHKLSRSRTDLVLTSQFLSAWKKAVFLQRFDVHTHLRAIVGYSSVQLQIAHERLGVPRDKLHVVKHPVDDAFWRPDAVPTERIVCSVGWEARDYSTLVQAVRGLDLEVRLAIGVADLSSSPLEAAPAESGDDRGGSWQPPAAFAREMGNNYTSRLWRQWLEELGSEGLPPNVRVDHQLGPVDLRRLYSRSLFAVIPLHDVDFDAGVTALTEAMAMSRAVIITRTRGQVDVIRDGEQGIVVPAADPRALRSAIRHLLDHPDEAQRMGRAGRALAEREHSFDDHISRLVGIAKC